MHAKKTMLYWRGDSNGIGFSQVRGISKFKHMKKSLGHNEVSKGGMVGGQIYIYIFGFSILFDHNG